MLGKEEWKDHLPLYNYYSDYALRVYSNRKCANGANGLEIPYYIPAEATSRVQRSYAPTSGISSDDEVGYADDLAMFSWSMEELQMCINILVKVFNEFGLAVNLDKTETMIINYDRTTEVTYPESIISVNGIN